MHKKFISIFKYLKIYLNISNKKNCLYQEKLDLKTKKKKKIWIMNFNEFCILEINKYLNL